MTRHDGGVRRKFEIPGLKDELPLGEALKQLTEKFGIKPCGGCAKRAAALNKLVFVPKEKK